MFCCIYIYNIFYIYFLPAGWPEFDPPVVEDEPEVVVVALEVVLEANEALLSYTRTHTHTRTNSYFCGSCYP